MYLGLKNVYFFDLVSWAEVDAQAEVLQRLVDEAGVAAFVARHVAHQRAHVLVLHVLLDLAVQHAAGELGGARADQELDELLRAGRAAVRALRPRTPASRSKWWRLLSRRNSAISWSHSARTGVRSMRSSARVVRAVEARRQQRVGLGAARWRRRWSGWRWSCDIVRVLRAQVVGVAGIEQRRETARRSTGRRLRDRRAGR